MKKILLRTGALLLMAIFAASCIGCGRSTKDTTSADTTSAGETTGESTSRETSESETSGTTSGTSASSLRLKDYFPLTPDISSYYAGTGNEFVPMRTYVEYVGKDTIQIVYDNGATEVHKLYAVRDGKVQVVYSQPELYAREDLSKLTPQADGEILLTEPLEVGTSWKTGADTRVITNLHASVTTPSGTYDAIEVTSAGSDVTTKWYYASGIGFVKMTVTGAYEITQELEERTADSARIDEVTLYYPRMTDTDVEITYIKLLLSMKTNDSLTDLLTEYFRKPPAEGLQPIMSANTAIHSMHLDREKNIVTIDLSREFVSEMNAGAAMEGAILQSLANTVGRIYYVEDVIVTIEGQLYESGHFAFLQGQTIKVSRDNIVEYAGQLG